MEGWRGGCECGTISLHSSSLISLPFPPFPSSSPATHRFLQLSSAAVESSRLGPVLLLLLLLLLLVLLLVLVVLQLL